MLVSITSVCTGLLSEIAAPSIANTLVASYSVATSRPCCTVVTLTLSYTLINIRTPRVRIMVVQRLCSGRTLAAITSGCVHASCVAATPRNTEAAFVNVLLTGSAHKPLPAFTYAWGHTPASVDAALWTHRYKSKMRNLETIFQL